MDLPELARVNRDYLRRIFHKLCDSDPEIVVIGLSPVPVPVLGIWLPEEHSDKIPVFRSLICLEPFPATI